MRCDGVDRCAVERLGKLERIAETIRRIGKTPAFPLHCLDQPFTPHPVLQTAEPVLASASRRCTMTSRKSVSSTAAKNAAVVITRLLGTASPAEQDLPALGRREWTTRAPCFRIDVVRVDPICGGER